VIVGGDLNLDLRRCNAHDKYYTDVISRCNLVDSSALSEYKVDYTYCDLYLGSYSSIDHFAVSSDLIPCVNEISALHDPLNPSKHRPITLDLTVKLPVKNSESDNNTNKNCDSRDPIMWHKSKDFVLDYQHHMNISLKLISERSSEYCKDVTCCDPAHLAEIDSLCDDLIECALKADSVFPRHRRGRKVLAGWNEFVKDYKDECQYWYTTWCEVGKPRIGIIFENMRETKRQYLYAVRRVKRRQKELKNKKFVDALAANNTRDFFKEIKKINPKPSNLCGVNGKDDHADIANIFYDKYEKLYNSIPSNPTKMEYVKEQIQCNVKSCDNVDSVISDHDIIKAVKALKQGKADGDRGFISDHLLLASHLYFIRLAKLLSAMYVHGHYPEILLSASIVSIPKDYNKSLSCYSNYRGIALCNAISKVADLIFLERSSQALVTSDMQYAFKKGMGTTLCTLVLKEVIQYYMSMKTPVYACFLDASKAFDRVRYDMLFNTLIKRGVNPLDLRLLLNQYQRQCIRTTWKGSVSCYFSTSNGIRQGSIASPTLFCVYLDELLCQLKAHGSGCWIGNYYWCISLC
jgi:hypothetical protein